MDAWQDAAGSAMGSASFPRPMGSTRHARAPASQQHTSRPPVFNDQNAVFATRNGTWHQVVNIERRWRQIRKGTGYEWVTPHTFRKTVATLISEATTSELASRQLGHSSSQVTRDHYIAKPEVSADLSLLLETLAQNDEPGPRRLAL